MRATAVITDGIRATAVITDGIRATAVITDGIRATAVITDGVRATYVITDGIRATGVITDCMRATAVITDGIRATAVITDGVRATYVITDGTVTIFSSTTANNPTNKTFVMIIIFGLSIIVLITDLCFILILSCFDLFLRLLKTLSHKFLVLCFICFFHLFISHAISHVLITYCEGQGLFDTKPVNRAGYVIACL
jgi:hypothetical protein